MPRGLPGGGGMGTATMPFKFGTQLKQRLKLSTDEKHNQNKSDNRLCIAHFPALHRPYVFASNSDWFVVLFTSVVIGWVLD